MQVVVRGKISLYEGRGDFQMIAEHMEEAGDGALRRAFELLKLKLENEGLFSEDEKQNVPELPEHLAIITSPTGAAIRDVLQVLGRRFPALKTTVIPVAVQGDEATPQIVEAIDLANRYQEDPFDAILLTRGGGSLEDLWAFNTEPVARAVFASDLPVVSAVGHEIDITIADFVADLRAPTPSAAAELLSPDQQVWQQQLDLIEQQFLQMMRSKQQGLTSSLKHLAARLRHPGERLTNLSKRFEELSGRLNRGIGQKLEQTDLNSLERRLNQSLTANLRQKEQQLLKVSSRIVSPRLQLERKQNQVGQLEAKLIQGISRKQQHKQTELETAAAKLNALSPLNTLQRGYSIVTRGESSTDVVTDAAQVGPGDQVTTRFLKGRATATIQTVVHDEDES